MPTPGKNETQDDFMSRCIPIVLDDGTATSQDQAVAICTSMWDNKGVALAPHQRAYSVFVIKKFNQEQRTIEGVATTPTPDRVGDIVMPLGAKFKLPIPLLWQHDSKQPIGYVTEAKATKDGISFKAQLAKLDEPGKLKDRLDEAWQTIKLGLVRAVSIGFAPIKFAFLKDGSGIEFQEWELFELSAVTIPANAEATINVIRNYDAQPHRVLAAPGRITPSASGHPRITVKRGLPTMAKRSLADQIKDWEATRAAHAAICAELMTKSDESGETLDKDESEKYEEANQKVKDIDTHLSRLREQLKAEAAAAKAIVVLDDRATPTLPGVGGSVRIQTAKRLEPGILFARYVIAMAAAKGQPGEAMRIAHDRWGNETPEVRDYIERVSKAVPGTAVGTSTSWGDDLVFPIQQGFLELLMPATIFGKLAGWYRVPFNVRVPIMTQGGTVNWVGEAAAKPVGQNVFDVVTLTFSKIAGIVVLSEELVRLASPSAETTVRNQLVKDIALFIDQQLLNTAVAEATSHPASITNGVTGHAATGTDLNAFLHDHNLALSTFDAANHPLDSIAMITTPAIARGIAGMVTPLGNPAFPLANPRGGSIQGFPLVVSTACPTGDIVYVDVSSVLLADDGGVTIDASTEATLDMSGGDTPAFSLWQKNCIGVRAERWIRWKKARTSTVEMVTGAAYAAGVTTI